VTNNSRQVSACSHHGRRRQTLEAFLITFITQPRRDGGAGHPREPQGSPYPSPQGPSACALSFAMVCPAPTRGEQASWRLGHRGQRVRTAPVSGC
jgi:hypothetical protein